MERRLDLDPDLLLLDADTAERILDGSVAPPDAPPGYAGVARLLQAVSSPPEPVELAGEVEAVVSMVAGITAGRARLRPVHNLRWRSAVAALAGGLTLTGGLATAGALPGPLQSGASAVLGTIGIGVAGSEAGGHAEPAGAEDHHAPGHHEVRRPAHREADDGVRTPQQPEADAPAVPGAAEHGRTVSDAAHEPAGGPGTSDAEVCAVASDHRCQPDHDAAVPGPTAQSSAPRPDHARPDNAQRDGAAPQGNQNQAGESHGPSEQGPDRPGPGVPAPARPDDGGRPAAPAPERGRSGVSG